jgi:hypothetical protein
MTTSGRPAPAGWYVDPLGQPVLRWWDGRRWTDDERPLPLELARRGAGDRNVARGPRSANGRGERPERPLRGQAERLPTLAARDWREPVGPAAEPAARGRGAESFSRQAAGTDERPDGPPPVLLRRRHAGSVDLARPSWQADRQESQAAAPDRQAIQAEVATVWLAALFGLALVATAAGYGLNAGSLRLAGVLGAVFFGVGAAPMQLSVRSGLPLRLAVAGVVGLSTLTVAGSVMVLNGGWHPVRAAAVIGLAAVAAHVIGCRRALRTLRDSGALGWPQPDWRSLLNGSVACTVSGTALWLGAALRLGHVVPGVGGFLPVISPAWYAGLVLLILAIVLARDKTQTYVLAALVSLISALTLTPAFAYGMPRSQSAAKHVDLVQQILSVHFLDRTAGIYQAYSGFFSAIAWVCDLAHVHDSIGIAAYWPFIVGLVMLAELRFFFGQILRPGFRIWVAVTLAVLVNALGADYFSPQSVGFVLGLGVYGLALGKDWPGLSERMRIALLVFAGCSLAVTHELSPYIVGGVLVVLVTFRVIRPWYVPATCLVPALLWALLNRHVLSGFISFADLGHLSNFAPPKTVSTPGLSRLPIVDQSSRALLLGLLVLIVFASIGFFRTVRTKPTWAFMIAPAVGLVLIAANPYGNEGIFRAALFGIPWLALLAMAAVPKHPPRWGPAMFGLVSVGLLTTFLVAMFGLDNAGVIRPADLQALSVYQRVASVNSDILNLSYGDIPVSATFPQEGGFDISWTQIATAADLRPTGPDAADAIALARNYIRYANTFSSAPPSELYAIWSPASAQYAVDYGLETLTESEKWRRVLAASPDWKVVYSADGTYLYRVTIP